MSYSELLGSIGDFIDTIPEEFCKDNCHKKYGHKQKHCTTGYLAHCEPDY